MKNKNFMIAGVALVFVLLSVGLLYWIFEKNETTNTQKTRVVVTSFEECIAAGYPVMESFPRQCSDSVNSFEEDIVKPQPYPLETRPESSPPPIPTQNVREKDGCVITGCNGEVCVSEEMSHLMGATPCIYKPEFACYDETICSQNAAGECAWQETPEFAVCIETVRTGNETKSLEVPFGLDGTCTDNAQCVGGACVLDGDEAGTGHCIDGKQIDGCAMTLADGEPAWVCMDDIDTGEMIDPPIR